MACSNGPRRSGIDVYSVDTIPPVSSAGGYHQRVPPDPAGVSTELRTIFGEIDIYLFDQLLRGRFDRRRRVLDAGCAPAETCLLPATRLRCAGGGRAAAIQSCVGSSPHWRPHRSTGFTAGRSCAVGRWMRQRGHLQRRAALSRDERLARCSRRCGACWRPAACSSRGWRRARLGDPRRYALPDGSERFVVDERTLLEWTSQLGGTLADPLKTTNVQNMRCMTQVMK